jgi:SagB-type dehydrogenase family enzyme
VIARDYHESTKHHFNRFAPSLGYLDWASQPDPFRRYAGAPLVELSRQPIARDVPYGALFERPRTRTAAALPLTLDHLGELLRCSMGLSAWKQAGRSRWALRVNPSSGNLHPTEAYLIHQGQVCHYAPREHALEQRALLSPDAWARFCDGRTGALLGLTSIHWREAWKYGERAFRYCQHDAGHAIGALSLAAAMLGWTLVLLPRWSSRDLAAVLGLDSGPDPEDPDPDDPGDAEPEEPECLAIVTPGDPAGWLEADPAILVDAARTAEWKGRPNRLSASHMDWPAIERVALATRSPGAPGRSEIRSQKSEVGQRSALEGPDAILSARTIMLQRRSAVAFDGQSSLPAATFLSMLQRLQPGAPPWDAIDWPPQVHLAVFVHRVDGLVPGVYAWLRDPAVRDEWQAAMRPEFIWEPAPSHLRTIEPPHLFLLLPFDMTWPANRVSCDQDIAADGFFSLGMIARFDASLRERGEASYRQLFWECGLIGQVLYLEAEAAGARATGIGCFYDDPVHEMLGLSGEAWQSLYHFSMGRQVDDPRLTVEPGYPWEQT